MHELTMPPFSLPNDPITPVRPYPIVDYYQTPCIHLCLVLVLARPPRLPVASAHVTPTEGGRRLAVTVTSERGVTVDRDWPIARFLVSSHPSLRLHLTS